MYIIDMFKYFYQYFKIAILDIGTYVKNESSN